MKPGLFQITLKVFVIRGDDFLILRDKDSGLGDLPGGRIAEPEMYEPFEKSIAREISEELGEGFKLNLNPDPLFVFPHRIQNGDIPAMGIAYTADYISGDVVLSDEHDFYEWVKVKNYVPAPLFKLHLLTAVEIFQSKFNLASSKTPGS